MVERGGLVAERARGAEGQGLCSRSPAVAVGLRRLWEKHVRGRRQESVFSWQ